MIINFPILAIFAYLMGSIPFGYIIPKLKGVDIRSIGSKATSGTNVSRALGWRWGLLSAFLDVIKAMIPVYISMQYITNPWHLIFIALMPTLGHIFPVWLKFKGGKGGSTFYGATVALIGFKTFLIFFIAFVLILLASKTTSVANLFFPWVLVILISLYIKEDYLIIYSMTGALFLTIALRENMQRIIDGTEPKTAFKF